MPEHTWTERLPGYTELYIDGNERGYVEKATRLAFWNFLPPDSRRGSYAAIAPRGTHPTVEAAQAALEAYVDAKDAVCDGTRGIQGEHYGCYPALCAPKR